MPRPISLLAAGACLAYPVLCHIAAVSADARWAAAGIVLVGWTILSSRRSMVFSAAAAMVLAGSAIAFATIAPAALVYAPPAALNLALCALFGATLGAGREPMISRFARIEHGGNLPSELAQYTRILTIMWSAFFALMAGISISLALWANPMAWSLFTNLVNYLLVLLFLVLEYAYRRVRYRHYPHASLTGLVRRLHGYRVFHSETEGRNA
jgi:uncharacterized membrane protein